jgi:hypothetical protein
MTLLLELDREERPLSQKTIHSLLNVERNRRKDGRRLQVGCQSIHDGGGETSAVPFRNDRVLDSILSRCKCFCASCFHYSKGLWASSKVHPSSFLCVVYMNRMVYLWNKCP